MLTRSRGEVAIAVATVVAVVGLLVLGAATGRPNWPVYLAVMLVGGATVVAIHVRVGFTRLTVVGLALFGVGHVAGGMIPVGDGVLYQHWIVEPVVRYDNLQHAWGFGFVGRATFEALRRPLGPVASSRTIAWWVTVLAASGLGAVNEIIEWVMVLTIPGTDVGGYDNTARDLVANLVGGVAVASWTARRTGSAAVRSE